MRAILWRQDPSVQYLFRRPDTPEVSGPSEGRRTALATPFERARSTRRLLVGGRLLLSLWAIGLGPADITDVVCPKRTGPSSLGFALLVASFAIGGVAGAMATPHLSARFGTSRVLLLPAALTAGTAVAAGAASSGPTAGACIAPVWSIQAEHVVRRGWRRSQAIARAVPYRSVTCTVASSGSPQVSGLAKRNSLPCFGRRPPWG